jgi:hypothetical protein
MYKKLTLAVAAVAVAAAFVAASSASAATLYTSSAHTTPVPVGSTFVVRMPSFEKPGGIWNEYEKEGSAPFEQCVEGQIYLTVGQNSGGVFNARVTNWAQEPTLCGPALQYFHVQEGGKTLLQVSGSPIVVGTNSDWLGTTLGKVEWQQAGFTGSGNYEANFTGATGNPPAKGIYVKQPTGKAPISIVLDRASATHLVGGLPKILVSAQFDFTGAAASWSFG